MADLTPTEKLQPCLLDRLTDDEPEKKEESRAQRVLSLQKYRKGVLRDLSWLFNASAYLSLDGVQEFNLKEFPEAYRSVINFGTRQLCGQMGVNTEQMQEEIAAVVKVFEPRISPRSLVIQADKERNLVSLEIEGDLWSHPVPEHLHVKTAMDVENGQCVFGDSPYGPPTA
jgi:type VI secretion system protein ImpF